MLRHSCGAYLANKVGPGHLSEYSSVGLGLDRTYDPREVFNEILVVS